MPVSHALGSERDPSADIRDMTHACAAGGAGERLVAWKHSLRRGRPRERKAQRHDTEPSLCFKSSPGTPLDETARDRDKAQRSSSRRARFTYSPMSRLRQSDASTVSVRMHVREATHVLAAKEQAWQSKVLVLFYN